MPITTRTRKQRPRPDNNRREDVRLAGGGAVAVTVLDTHGQPAVVLRDPVVLNVAAGGIALTTPSRVDSGERLAIVYRTTSGGDTSEIGMEVEVLESLAYHDGRNKVRCRLAHGHVPAQLIHGW